MPAPTPSPGQAVELRDVTLRAGGRLLLDRGTARFEPGQITLLVGPSGAGKSLLLRAIAGLLDPSSPDVSAEGQVVLGGDVLPAARQAGGRVGIVFQNFALFDELSPLDNIRFAASHRFPRAPATPRPSPGQWLTELGVPAWVRTASLSGGQKQRLAIARTLAYDPQVIVYDEPTSGLDPATSVQVARLIQATHAAHRKTSIVVTHDIAALAPIADRIWLLDPRLRSLRVIEPELWPKLDELILPAPADAPAGPAWDRAAAGSARRWLAAAAARLGDFLVGASRAAEQAAAVPWRLLPRWRSPAWGLRFLLHYLRLVADPSAWLYVALAGAIAGFVATYFTFRFLPFRNYTEPLVIEELLQALGFALYRILVPVLATILVAARCGAAVASDVGGKVYGRQVDALRTFGAEPARYLATNILWAFLAGTLLLVAIAYAAARLTSLVVFSTTHPQYGPFFWESHFHRELVLPGGLFYRGTGWLAAKLLLCAAGMGVIAYDRGSRPKHSETDVSTGITSTVLWATLHVLVVHLGFALFEFE